MSCCVLVRALASGDLQLSKSKSGPYCSSYVGLKLNPVVADVECKSKFCQGNYKKSSLHEIAGISLIFANLMKDPSNQRLVI